MLIIAWNRAAAETATLMLQPSARNLRLHSPLKDTGKVPDFCTCGAQLPPDARFCHKCGKPQFEEPVWRKEEEELAPEPPAALAAPPPPPEINFRNRVAVRAGFLAAGIMSLLISVPMPVYFGMLWILGGLIAAGFLGVFFYIRRTRQPLTPRGGARLGWMTGVFCFAIVTVFFTLSVLMISSRGGLAGFYREQFAAKGATDVNAQQFLEILESPGGLATVLLLSILFLFVLFTLLSTLGGALGAKVLAKE